MSVREERGARWRVREALEFEGGSGSVTMGHFWVWWESTEG